MSIYEDFWNKEMKVIKLDGTEKTWIGEISQWRFRDDPLYAFVRCIDVSSKETMTVKLIETNSNYEPRYYTNLPPFWDNHAVIRKAPETVLKHEYTEDVFEDKEVLKHWLGKDGEGFWDDGFTEWEDGEFEQRVDEYTGKGMEHVEVIPYAKWLLLPQNDEESDW